MHGECKLSKKGIILVHLIFIPPKLGTEEALRETDSNAQWIKYVLQETDNTLKLGNLRRI